SGHQILGVVARLSDETAKHFDVKQEVFFASLNWTVLSKLIGIKTRRAYQEISRYPIVERDLAVTVSKNEAAGALLETIRRTGGKLLQEVRVFDLYEGDNIAPDTKSIAFSLRLGASDRTLVDKEVETLVARVVKQLADRHRAVLRA
ncbi:MAG TPA: phenylalanine--tRNA ligase subunit beta, partial [Rhodothermales bacterium]|nr:phenylalanine--tRNA ligase subunit beta [Rhodothermales bacterium]